MTQAIWQHVEDTSMLDQKGKMIFRTGTKQILIIRQGDEIFAINNRCPHEGFPLSEGSMSKDCKLTCNWHNWKFDLKSGNTLVGGDKLRRYPLREDQDGLWLDVQDAPAEEQVEKSLENIQASFRRFEYARMGRELARLKKAGGKFEQAARFIIKKNYDRFEWGFNHAFAAMNDWFVLSGNMNEKDNAEGALVAALETISHVAWDTLREENYPFTDQVLPYSSDDFLQAVEAENENQAVALIRGALQSGMNYADLEEDLVRAALSHYNDFGHSIIYVYKCGQLIKRLGDEMAEFLLLPLVRAVIYARREDLLPEFRQFSQKLSQWDGQGKEPVTSEDFIGLSVNKALDRVLQSSADIKGLYDALYGALCWNMAHFDLRRDQITDQAIAQNVGWLDFTHGLTMSNAIRKTCERFPDLWPTALLQLACFVGRNSGYVDKNLQNQEWIVADKEEFFSQQEMVLLDHGLPEPIISCHRVKLLYAVMEDVRERPEAPWVNGALAALNRFVNSPIKRKHSLRIATQALQFVAREG